MGKMESLVLGMALKSKEYEYIYATDWVKAKRDCLPKRGFLKSFEDESGTFDGIVAYSRLLTNAEVKRFGLLYLGKVDKKS